MTMKKVLSILFAGLLALVAVSCVKEQLTILDLSQSTAPVIGQVEYGEKAITINFTPAVFKAGFNQNMPVNHSLVLTSLNGSPVNITVPASIKDNVATISVAALSKVLIAKGLAEGSTASLELVLRALMQGASSDVSGGALDAEEKIVINSYEIVLPASNPWVGFDEISPWSLIGAIESVGMEWNGDIVMYANGNQHVARAVKLSAGDQFKFRKDKAWGENFGAEGDVEPFVVTLDTEYPAAAGGKNLSVPADGYYDLLLDTDAKTFTIYEAYLTYPTFTEKSAWSVIGAIESFDMEWNKDIAMTTDGEWHVAEGVALTTADQFKFRKDLAWGENFGAEGDVEPFVVTLDTEYPAAAGGKNLGVPADGTYDLLVNPEAKLFKVVESLGGKSGLVGGDEPEPEEKPEMWSLIGTLDGSNWDKDFDMSNISGDTWIIRSVQVGASDEFKIRADHDWAKKFGGPEANSTSTINESDPYGVYKPEIGKAFEAKDVNIQIGKEGIYDVTFDYAAMTILVEEHQAVYSLIGEVDGSSWNKDFAMTEKDGVWTSPVVKIAGKFKIRYDYSWEDENVFGLPEGGSVLVGTAFTAAQPGTDMELAEGNYTVQFTPATKEVFIQAAQFPTQLYMIGEEFGGWDWGSDDVVEMTPVIHNPEWGAEAEGQFWTVRYFSAGKGFKFNSKREWNGDFWGLGTNDGFTESEGNCTVDADGFYMVHVDLKRSIVHIEPARIYGIGNCFGGWDEGMEGALFTADGKTLKATAAGDGELRMYAASDISTSDWWTREFVILDGKIDYRGDDEGQGDQARVNVQKGQVVSLDFNAGTGSITGEGEAPELPATMYIIGDAVGGWDWTGDYIVDMTPVNGQAGQFWAIRYIEAEKGFKFCAVKDWNGDFTGLGEDTGYTVDGGNCYVAENGVYMIYVDTDNKKLCIEKAQVYGIGDCFGGWDTKMESALFTEKDGKLVGKTKAAGEIRLYAESSIATSDWWAREFVFFDGKIAYRGNGDDQDRVNVEAEKTVTLDFNAGTAVVE